MKATQHLSLFIQSLTVWALFWLAGLPDYYRQYSPATMAIFCVLVTVMFSLAAVFFLLRWRTETMLRRSVFMSIYCTVPFAILDWLYCGVHLGYGGRFLGLFWYLAIFYIIPWITLIPMALLFRRRPGA